MSLLEFLPQGNKSLAPGMIEALQTKWKRYTRHTEQELAIYLRKLCRQIDEATGSALAEAVKVPKGRPAARQRTATPDELQRLFRTAQPAMRMYLALTYLMALRNAEARSVGWSNYSAEKQTVTVKTKGGKFREFPVHPELKILIEACPEGPGSFIELLHGRSLKFAGVYRMWRKLLKRAGVKEDLNPHDLRRTAAVNIYRETKDVFAAKTLLGHDSLSSTSWYLQPHEPAAFTEAANALKAWDPRGHRVQ